jgi:hypothetical protein
MAVSSREEEVWPSSSKRGRAEDLPPLLSTELWVMAYLLKKRRSALPIPKEEGKDDHGHLTQQQP